MKLSLLFFNYLALDIIQVYSDQNLNSYAQKDAHYPAESRSVSASTKTEDDPCAEVVCEVENEICDNATGECMCGSNESCADKPWASNCNYFGEWKCSCGITPYSCDPDSQVCHKDTPYCTYSPCKYPHVECEVDNEVCDGFDGLCKCGRTGESCENKPWSPTCNELRESCSCGNNPPCTEGIEICDETHGLCLRYDYCAGVACKPNESCDSKSGKCKCGFGESCENKWWAPTCVLSQESDTYACECGTSKAECVESSERCNEGLSTCLQICPDGYHSFNGNCYGSDFSAKTWDEARLYCLNLTDSFASFHLSFDLPSIHSSDENDLIYGMCNNMGVHLGLKREAGETEFTWTDGSQLDYIRWFDKYPRIEDYLTAYAGMNHDNGQPENFKVWYDFSESPGGIRVLCKGTFKGWF